MADYDALEDGSYEITGETFTITWQAEGDVQEYYLMEYRGEETEGREIGYTTQTSITLQSSDYLPAKEATLRIGAIPTNGTLDDAQWSEVHYKIAGSEPDPEPTADPWGEPVNADTEPERIALLQNRLLELGWLHEKTEDGFPAYQEGTFDQATMQAVLDFQTWYNENVAQSEEMMLVPILFDGTETQPPFVSVESLKLLMDAEKEYKKPAENA